MADEAALEADLATIDTDVASLKGRAQALQDEITALQNQPQPVTSAQLDSLVAHAQAIDSALNAIAPDTPPTPLPAPPAGP